MYFARANTRRCVQRAVVSACVAGLCSTVDGKAETVRFLVAESERSFHYDSYVLPLSDPADIAFARLFIPLGDDGGLATSNHHHQGPTVVAQIAAGANGINRNYLAPGAPEWSWHVVKLEQFGTITIEILDGNPTYVESDVEGWIANTYGGVNPSIGRIGFWAYTVVAELPTGDYDADLDVDDADYFAWKATFGSISNLSADGNGNGIVDAADYVVWRKNLGASTTLPPRLFPPASDVSVAIPEPATVAFVLLLCVTVTAFRPRHGLYSVRRGDLLRLLPCRSQHR